MRKILSSTLAGMALLALAATPARAAPYPASTTITGVTWDQSSYQYGGIGGDLWPVASAAGGTVYTAWGDGVVGCRTKVSYGVAAIAGGPSANLRVVHCGPAGSGNGKIGSLLAVGSTLYGGFDPQHPAWPNSTLSIVRSTDGGRTWKMPSWNFGSRELIPNSFVAFGPGNSQPRDGYVYMPATKGGSAHPTAAYLMRVPAASIGDKAAYQYFSGSPANPAWSASQAAATPVFSDRGGVNNPSVTYDRALRRYLLVVGHGPNAGHLGLFEGDEPWGPWRTVAYEDRWLGMTGGDFLGVQLPSAWLSTDGRMLWAVFSCYGKGGACGRYQDRYNLISGRLQVSGG